MMRILVATVLFVSAFTLSTDAVAQKKSKETKVAKLSHVPEGMFGLSAQMVGYLVSKDVEKGELILAKTRIRRIWRNNKARRPHSGEGKTLRITGVRARFLDNLLLIKPGQPVIIEVKQVGKQKHLTFLGEELRKAKSSELKFKRPKSKGRPEGKSGFRGVLAGRVASTNADKGTISLKVARVSRVWRGSQVRRGDHLVGKSVVAFVHKKKFPRHRGGHMKLIKGLKKGELIEFGTFQGDGNRYMVVELLRRVKKVDPKLALQGFRGILVGKVVDKDAEKGTVVVQVERVKRTWKNNKARSADSSVGHKYTLTGVSGRFLDVLVTIKKGERLEFGAVNERGDTLRFPGELLRKVGK